MVLTSYVQYSKLEYAPLLPEPVPFVTNEVVLIDVSFTLNGKRYIFEGQMLARVKKRYKSLLFYSMVKATR